MTDIGAQLFEVIGGVTCAEDRVYPLVLRQGCEMPAIAYTVVTEQPINSLQGFTSGLRNARVQVDCHGKTRAQAVQLFGEVDALLSSLTTAALTSSQVSRRDLYDDVSKLFRVSVDYSLWSTA